MLFLMDYAALLLFLKTLITHMKLRLDKFQIPFNGKDVTQKIKISSNACYVCALFLRPFFLLQIFKGSLLKDSSFCNDFCNLVTCSTRACADVFANAFLLYLHFQSHFDSDSLILHYCIILLSRKNFSILREFKYSRLKLHTSLKSLNLFECHDSRPERVTAELQDIFCVVLCKNFGLRPKFVVLLAKFEEISQIFSIFCQRHSAKVT